MTERTRAREGPWKGGEPDPAEEGGKAAPPDVRVANSPTRCPFCHEDVGADAPVTVCQGCLSRHHAACWAEGGRCGSCQGTHALEAAPEKAGPGGCRCCGLQAASARYRCPGCRADVCEGCYRPRFRRCVGCATELLQAEKRLELVKKRKDGAEAAIALSIIGALLTLAGAIGLSVSDDGPAAAVALTALVAVALAAVAVVFTRRQASLDLQLEELELLLAPFQETGGLVHKGVKWLKDQIGM